MILPLSPYRSFDSKQHWYCSDDLMMKQSLYFDKYEIENLCEGFDNVEGRNVDYGEMKGFCDAEGGQVVVASWSLAADDSELATLRRCAAQAETEAEGELYSLAYGDSVHSTI